VTAGGRSPTDVAHPANGGAALEGARWLAVAAGRVGISQNAAPVSIIVVLAQQGDGIMLVEKRAKPPGDLIGGL
jgi:hypothetical protein